MSRSHRSLSAFFAFLLAAGSLAGSAFGAPPLEGSQAHLSSAALAAKVRVASRLRLNAGSSAATVPLETYLRGLKTLAYSTTAGSTGTLESETFPSLQVPLDVDIYPGMIISGEPTLINGGKTKPIRLSRGSGDVFVDGLNFANPNAAASRTVAAGPENAFHTAVTQAVHSLASQPLVGNQLGERVECEEHRIYSKDDLMYTLQASYSYAFIASVSGSLSGATDHTSNHVLLWCQHEYYTASFVPDARAGVIGGAAYFGNDVTPASASQFMGAGAPPLVVSEVTYGSQLMALFDSEHTADELKAAVHGSVNYGVQSVSVDASGDSKKVLDDSSIEIYAVGGRASAVAPVVASIAKGDGAAALNKYLAQTVNISGSDGNALESGQPLTYAVQDLAGNDVAFKSTVYYSGKNATGAELDHASISFHTNDDDKDHDTNVDMFLEDSTGTNILRATVNDDRHFDDHSDSPAYRFKPINSAPIYAGDLTGGKFKMIVQTNGHDTWKFTGYLTLYFKNGTKTIYTTAPQSVDQNYGQHQYNFGDYFS